MGERGAIRKGGRDGPLLVQVDSVSLNYLLGGVVASMASIMNPEPSMVFNVIDNFIAALVLALVYDRVRGSFGPGVGGGLAFGLYAGLLVNLPAWLGLRVFIKNIPYGTAWVMTCYGVVVYTVLGAVAGYVSDLGEPKAA